MQVFHTCGVPPNFGRIILPIMGWTKNSKKALTNNVRAKSGKAKGHLHENRAECFNFQVIIVEERAQEKRLTR